MKINNKIKKLATLAVIAFSLTVTALASSSVIAPKADSNPASWVLCRFEDGKVAYNAAVTDLIPYTFRSKSAITTIDEVDTMFLNKILELSGHDFKAINESILGRPLRPVNLEDADEINEAGNAEAGSVNPFDRFGVAGLRWSSYAGEWKYYQIDACSKAEEVSKTNFGAFYEGRQEPKSSYGEVSGSRDPRSIQFNKGLLSSWKATILDTVANALFSVTKAFMTVTISIVSVAFTDLTELLGLSGDNAAPAIMMNIYHGLFQPLVILAFVFTAIHLFYKGAIKRELRYGLQSLAKALMAFFVAVVITSNPVFWVSAPNKLTVYGQALVLNALPGTYQDNSSLCVGTSGDVLANINPDSGASELDRVGQNIRSAIGCRLWEETLFKPWARGQFGTEYTSLEDSALKNANKDWVGDGFVPLGGDGGMNNWAMFQLSTQTNAHAQIGEKADFPNYVNGVNADWWRVGDALSNYQEEQVTETPDGAEGSISYEEQINNEPLQYWNSWAGNNATERVGIAFLSIFFGLVAAAGPFVFGLMSAVLGLGVTLMMMLLPLFLLFGTWAGKGQQISNGYIEAFISTVIKKIFVSVLLIMSFAISTGAMNLINSLGWIQAFILLCISTLILIKNRNQILSAVANVDFGGVFDPRRGFSEIRNKHQQRAKRVASVGVAGAAGAKAAHDTGQSLAEGSKTGAFAQFRDTLYQTKLGTKTAIAYSAASAGKDGMGSYTCVRCAAHIHSGIAYVDEDGNMYCKFCGDESANDRLMEITVDPSISKSGQVRTRNATNNQSWLSFSKTKELMGAEYNRASGFTWDNDGVENMIRDNVRRVNEDIIRFEAHRKEYGTSSRPPSIPEPLQEYLDLALVNEAWTSERYDYIDRAYREGWKMWYEENGANVANLDEERFEKFLKEIEHYQPEIDKEKVLSETVIPNVYHSDDKDLFKYEEGSIMSTEADTEKFRQELEIDTKHKTGKRTENPRK